MQALLQHSSLCPRRRKVRAMGTALAPGADAFLILVGAILQGLGFILGILDVLSGANTVREHLARQRQKELRGRVGARAKLRAALTPGRTPTLEERVGALEGALDNHIEGEERERDAAIESLDQRFREDLSWVHDQLERQTSAINALIDTLTVRPKPRRILAIVLFVAGLILVTAGSIGAII